MMSNWANLPEELLILILSDIFAKDRQRFRLVCKSWNEAVLALPNHSFPCLTIYQNSSPLWKFVQYNAIFNIQVPQIHNAEILCSKYGWFLMLNNKERSLFLFHPFDNQIIELPVPYITYHVFSFFNPPTSSDCIIIGLLSTHSVYFPSVDIGIFRLRDLELESFPKWEFYQNEQKKLFKLSACNPILHRGFLYFVDVRGDVGRFNIEETSSFDIEKEGSSCEVEETSSSNIEETSSFDIEKEGSNCEDVIESLSGDIYANCLSSVRLRRKLQQQFLVKLDWNKEEAIFCVFIACDGKTVRVYKLLEPNMKWQLVENLGDKMLFLSHAGSFGVTAPSDSMANKIYFTKFYGDASVFYSLDTKKYHSFDGRYNSPTCDDLEESCAASWIVPT